MQVDIAAETLKVGNAMASVRIDQMILNLAKGIAWGQYELDKVGVDITKMMGVPGIVSIGGEKISMLEAGFLPSFYHFVDTILEMKMEVNIREEKSSHMNYKQSMSRKMETEAGVEVSAKVKVNAYVASAEMGMKAQYKQKASSAYAQSLDAGHSQKFSQDLSASSLMRTKLVPVPAPELLVERIRILLDKLREESEQGFWGDIPWTDAIASALDPENQINDEFKAALGGIRIDLVDDASVSAGEGENQWFLQNGNNRFRLQKVEEVLKVYVELTGGSIEEQQDQMGDMLMQKVEDRLLERMEGM
jgi:hypothetical protein